MTTKVTVTACGNPRTGVTVNITDRYAGRDETVEAVAIPPGETREFHATDTRSISISETRITD